MDDIKTEDKKIKIILISEINFSDYFEVMGFLSTLKESEFYKNIDELKLLNEKSTEIFPNEDPRYKVTVLLKEGYDN